MVAIGAGFLTCIIMHVTVEVSRVLISTGGPNALALLEVMTPSW
jgi:hypothetical protein